MKNGIFSILFATAFLSTAIAQERPVKFTVEVSTDSILMGNNFEVKFILENANGNDFEAPDFSDHFNVVSGPNFSSSFSMVNGTMTQSQTITYYLEPRDIGAYYILPASVNTGDKILETVPLEVLVVPNPDGIKQSPPNRKQPSFFDWGSNPFNFDFSFPAIPEMKEQEKEAPLPPSQIPKEQPATKKRKTIRI
ncbi:MAG: BatD family protein [Lewinellaceae bacterium]|nr:BatD family protein [Saprospiraceae bacterium]MCB9337651.1 BatD family protein [Lewinellaceae bacterium]